MATVSTSGLISPSPSITELDKAEESHFAPKMANAPTADVNGAKEHEKSNATAEQTKDDEHTTAVEEKTGTAEVEQEIAGFATSPNSATNSVEVDEARIDGKKLDGKKPDAISRPEKFELESDLESDDANTDSDSVEVADDPARRRKYLRGYGAYIMSLEKRISELEASKGAPTPIPTTVPDFIRTPAPLRSRRVSDASSFSRISIPEIRTMIPSLKFMTWEEYLVRKGRTSQVGSHAIDVLMDEPILYHQRTRKKHSHDGIAPSQAIEIPPSAARKCEGLPSRIRINSELILQHLWRITKKRFPLWKPNHPRVILRPYKMLYLYENDLRYLLIDLEAKVKENQEDPLLSPKVSRQETENVENITTPHESNTRVLEPTSDEVLDEADPAKHPTEHANKTRHDLEDGKDDFTRVDLVFEKSQATLESTEPKVEVRPPIKTFEERLNSEEGINDLKCLISFIDDFLRPVQNEYDTCKREKVRFSELWHLLKPDQLAYVTEKNCPQHIWRVVQVTGGRPYLSPYVPPPPSPPQPPGVPVPPPPPSQAPSKPKAIAAGYDEISPFVVDCEYIDYNGVRFGPIFRKFHIDPFEDEMDIKSLTVVPYKYATKYELIKEEELRLRGEKFLEFTEAGHRYYAGKTLTRTPLGVFLMCSPEEGYYRPGPPTPVSEETVESEVIVDFDRTFNHNPNWAPRLGEDIIFEMMDNRETREPEYEDNSEGIDYDMEWDRQMRNDIMAIINVQTQRYFSKDELPKGNDVLLLPSRVYAFILRSRKWAALDINNLRPIKARQNGFDDLELPSGHKEVVQALVQTHFRRSKKKGQSPPDEEDEEQFDLVRDKGKGLIILLHGAPGVGKTSTAECVAESNNVPLLPITCGDLGITAQDVERKLEMNFRLAQAWGCVLLLDEADVFLAQRSSSDLERNAVVSVFLRVLEYYEGILFLTTNRVGAFDEAFKSRIHLSLFFPWLNAVQTIKIWDGHMRRIKERIKTIEIDKEQILAYASLHFDSQCRLTGGTGWNGRQIRNAFQSATALAQFECKSPSAPVYLQVRHFEIVAKAAAEFDDYLIRTTGHSDAERAAFNMIRTDTFNPNPRNPMSWESLTQAVGGYGQGAGAAHMAFGGGVGGNMGGNTNIQAAFSGSQNQQIPYGGGGQGMQPINQGNFAMGIPQAMPFQQSNYGMQVPSAQASFMSVPAAQMSNQGAQMWPLQHNQSQGVLQHQVVGGGGSGSGSSGIISLPRELSQMSVSGQSQGQGQGATDIGMTSQPPQQPQQQVPGQGQGQGLMGGQALQQGTNHTAPQQQGFGAVQGFGQYPQGGQGFSR